MSNCKLEDCRTSPLSFIIKKRGFNYSDLYKVILKKLEEIRN